MTTDTVDEVARDRRRAVTQGLRKVADFLDAHPDFKLPVGPRLGVVATTVAEYEQLTEMLDGEPEATSAAHQVERRWFGPVEVAVHISRTIVLEDRERKLAEREAQASQAAA